MLIDGVRASDRAIERVLAYYAAFNRGDLAAMCGLLADDVRHDINQGGSEIGHEAFRVFLERMLRCYRESVRDVVVMATQDGCHVAAEYVVEGDYLADEPGLPPANGQHYQLRGGAFFELRDGKITRVSNYYNLQEWLRQVGSEKG